MFRSDGGTTGQSSWCVCVSLLSCSRMVNQENVVGPPHLLEVVEGGQDDVMAASDQANSSEQFQHQSFGPDGTSSFHLSSPSKVR